MAEAKKVRWGILGPGRIARKFPEGLRHVAGAELVAVGSRSRENAEKFGEEFQVPRRHDSYEKLAADPDVDAVYVATPHPFHKDNSILCLKAGKAVLCEKPFTVNAADAQAVVRVARRRKVLLMEAMWSRFLPPIVKLRELLAAGTIGEVRMVMADFGFRAGWEPQSRLLNPQLAGGGLLDVGIYPVSLSSMILGMPDRVAGLAHLGQTGVDEQAAVVLGHTGGALSLIATGVRTNTPHVAYVLGTEGSIQLHPGWWRGSRLTVRAGGKTEDLDVPMVGNGYNYEADEIARCLAAGKTESDVLPLSETLSIMKTMDAIRAQWGLKYPME